MPSNQFSHRLYVIVLSIWMTLMPVVSPAVTLGQPAPAFELPGDGATSVNLAALRGKVVYLDFWASWCGPCRQSFPWMNDLQAKYASRGLQVLAINVDAKQADAQKFLSETTGKFQIAYDNKGITPKLYGVKGMPTSYLIDREGRVVYEHSGFSLSKASGIEKEIEKLLDTK